MSDIKQRLDEANLLLTHLKFHLATIQEQKKRIAEKKLKSQLTTQDKEANIIALEASSDETLKARVEYFYLCKEELDTIAEIRAKIGLLSHYEAHYEATIKEERKVVSDKEILSALNELRSLRHKSLHKKNEAISLADSYQTLGIDPETGLSWDTPDKHIKVRYEYLTAVKNFIKDNS